MSGKIGMRWKRKPSEAKLAEIENLYEMGLYDQQVADYVGVSVETVARWRKANGKEANRTRCSVKRSELSEPPPAQDEPPVQQETPKMVAKAAPPAPLETVHQKWKQMRQPCRKCGFWNEMFWCCDYLSLTGRRRPCPPGSACTVRK